MEKKSPDKSRSGAGCTGSLAPRRNGSAPSFPRPRSRRSGAGPPAPSGLRAEVDEFESSEPLDGAAGGGRAGSAARGRTSDTATLELGLSAPR
jgi:hypothetical protein